MFAGVELYHHGNDCHSLSKTRTSFNNELGDGLQRIQTVQLRTFRTLSLPRLSFPWTDSILTIANLKRLEKNCPTEHLATLLQNGLIDYSIGPLEQYQVAMAHGQNTEVLRCLDAPGPLKELERLSLHLFQIANSPCLCGPQTFEGVACCQNFVELAFRWERLFSVDRKRTSRRVNVLWPSTSYSTSNFFNRLWQIKSTQFVWYHSIKVAKSCFGIKIAQTINEPQRTSNQREESVC